VPSLPRHLTDGKANGASTPGSPLAGSPRTFSSRDASPENDLESIPVRRDRDECYDSSEEEDKEQVELVTEFDRVAVQRAKDKKGKQAPLVIPSAANPDWRDLARKRRSHKSFVPEAGRVGTGVDGSVGGLGTRDSINSGPQLSGLQQVSKRVKVEHHSSDMDVVEETTTKMEAVPSAVKEETEDEKALRVLLAGEDGTSQTLDIITPQLTEDDAFDQDVNALPESATAADYARVPVEAFGAALLRGMGWKEGESVSRTRKGLPEPYLPNARPALLGIGAKEQEVYDDGSKKGEKKRRNDPKKYMPVVRRESERDGGSGSRSGTASRKASRSPPRRYREDDKREGGRDRGYDDRSSRKERDYDDRRRDGKDYDDRRSDKRDYDDRRDRRDDYVSRDRRR